MRQAVAQFLHGFKQRRQRKRGPGWALMLVVGLVVAFFSVILLLGSESGRIIITRGGITAAQHFLPDLSITTGQLASRELGHWYFSELDVQYGNKSLLHAQHLSLTVNISQLINKRIEISGISASNIQFNNSVLGEYLAKHAGTEQEIKDSDELGDFTPPAMRLGSLAIERLKIIDANLPSLPEMAVSGSGSFRWPGEEPGLRLEVKELDGFGLHLQLRGTQVKPKNYELNFSANERAGGFLSSLLQLPEGQALDADGELSLQQTDDNHLLLKVKQFSLPLVNHQFGLSGSSAITLSPWAISSDDLTLIVDDTEHLIRGRVNAEQITAILRLNKLPLAISQPWQDYLHGGWLSADLEINGPLSLPAVNGTLDLSTQYEGQALLLNGQVETAEQLIRLSRMQLKLGEAALLVTGEVDVKQESINLQGLVQQLELSSIRALLVELPQTKEIELPAELDGAIERLQVNAKGPWTDPELAVELIAQVQYQQLLAKLQGVAKGNLKKFTISDLSLDSKSLRIVGGGDVNIEKETLKLQLDVNANDLRPVEQLNLPLDPGTVVNLDSVVAVSGSWKNPRISAQLESHGNYREYRYTLRGGAAGDAGKLTFDRLRLDLIHGGSAAAAESSEPEPVDLLKGPQSLIAGKVEAPDEEYPLRKPESTIEDIAERVSDQVAALRDDATAFSRTGNAWLELNGVLELQAQKAEGTVAGRNIPVSILELAGVQLPPSLNGEISIDGQFSGPFTKPLASANVLGLGSYRGEPWQLQGDVNYGDARIDLTDVKLFWGGRNQLLVHGSLSEQALDLKVEGTAHLADLDQWFSTDISDTGEVTLWATASGTPRHPELAGEFKLTGRAPQVSDDASEEAPLNFVFDWHTNNDELKMSLNASHGQRTGATAAGTLAVGPILEQLFSSDSGEKPPLPIKFDAKGSADLEVLGVFMDPEIHSMRGRMNFNLQADGNARDPNMRGGIDLQDGYYEHRPSNTILRKIVFVAEMTPEQWRIVKASARDSEKGKISLDGAVTFNAPAPPKLDFNLRADKAHLLNMPAAKGAFSGALQLSGNTENALLAGKITIRPLAVQVEHLIGGSVPEIEVTELEVDGPQDTKAPPLLQNMALSVQIVLDKQSYVRGLGLDSELRGEVDVGGTAADPQAGGELRIVRGKFDLLGKKFELQEGQVQFENNVAAIYVKGVHTYPDGEITAVISGTTDDLDVTFSSEPAAAQDEIFAQLLFGKSLTDISPLQAIRLVSVVRTLQSGGTGFDPVAKTRELIGLDTLDFESEESDEGDQYALSLGKYITSRIYIELQRSTNPLNPWQAEMQIELNKNLRLEIKSADDSESGAGSIELQWKKDY